MLIDVGTVPRDKAIYRLWKAFRTDPNVAGACGEIVASKGKLYHDLVNPLVGAQNFGESTGSRERTSYCVVFVLHVYQGRHTTP